MAKKKINRAAVTAPTARIPNFSQGVVTGDGSWPFQALIDGNDIVVNDIVITCFGGAFDPQDDGETASGVNTRNSPNVQGVSLPMDGRQYSMSPAEHRALDGSPIPKMPWHTLVEVTIKGKTFTPQSGVLDLGPGKQASRPGEPHALDLTVAAAKLFAPDASLQSLATCFEARGRYRIFGGAKYLKNRSIRSPKRNTNRKRGPRS
jgi:hypothetical protein